MPSEKNPTKFDLYLKLTTLLAWPIMILILLVIFWRPIKLLSSKLPKVVQKSETISIAGITLKMTDQITQKPTAKINEALTGLGHEPLLGLLELGVDEPSVGGIIGYDTATYNSSIKHLTNRGLLKVIKPNPTDTNINNSIVKVRMTKLGVKSSLVLADLFKVFVQELSKSNKPNDYNEDE